MRSITIFLLVSVLFLSCQREINPGTTDNNLLTPQAFISNLQGNIYDEDARPAAGVTVRVGVQTAMTNANGYFRIEKALLDKNASLVTAEKAGYFKAYRTFSATSGANQVVIKLTPKISAGIVNAAAGGAINLSNGSKVALPANSVVTSSGAAYSGMVNIYAAYIDPSRPDIGETVPGSMMANDKDGKRVTLSSFGMMNVELESASGEKLQIATGQTATLTTAIPSSLQSSAPASISMWYVDEQTGIWKEEGMATKTGNSYVGEVKHFTPWNCDILFPGVMIKFTIKNADHLPLVNAHVQMTCTARDVNMNEYCWTDSLGQIRKFVPAGREISITVLDPCNNPVYSKAIGTFPQDADAGIVYVSGASIVTIKGKISGCSFEKLSASYAVVSMNNMIHTVKADANGNFITNFTQCVGMPNMAQIIGVNMTTMEQGLPVSIPTTAAVNDAGTITACGNSLPEYINYTLDGTNYVILDSLDAYTISGRTYIFARSPLSNEGFNFHVDNVSAAGTYQMILSNVREYRSAISSQGSVTFTVFPQIGGGYYEGTLSMQFRDGSNLLHVLTGSFRMRRRF